MSILAIRRALTKYALAHQMSEDVAAGMQVAALLGWLEADERREERERLEADGGEVDREGRSQEFPVPPQVERDSGCGPPGG